MCRFAEQQFSFPVLTVLASPAAPKGGQMFIAVSTIIAVLAIGWWWLDKSEAAVARKRDEKQRELERPDHERARQIAEIQSDLSRLKGSQYGGYP